MSKVPSDSPKLSATRVSETRMRTDLPARCTLPSTMRATLSVRAISGSGRFLPLKENAEVRGVTRRPRSRMRASAIASVRPSEKYSLAGSLPTLAKGRTAREISGVATSAGVAADISEVGGFDRLTAGRLRAGGAKGRNAK